MVNIKVLFNITLFLTQHPATTWEKLGQKASSNELVLSGSHWASIIIEESRYQEHPSLSQLSMAMAPTTERLDVNLAVHGDVFIMTSHATNRSQRIWSFTSV